MTWRIIGRVNSTVAEVEAANKAVRETLWAGDFEFRGAYSVGLVSVAKIALGDNCFGFRVGQAGGVCWIKRVNVGFGMPSVSAAGTTNLSLYPVRPHPGYGADTALSKVYGTPSPLRATMPPSLTGFDNIGNSNIRFAGDDGASNSVPLTGGTISTMPLASVSGAARATAAVASFKAAVVPLFGFRPGEEPYIIGENEGFYVQVAGSSTPLGIFNVNVSVVWEEYVRRW